MVLKENAICLSNAMSKGFAPVSTTTQRPTLPTAPAVEAQEIQSKWLSYFEDLDDPRGAKGRLHPFLSVVRETPP